MNKILKKVEPEEGTIFLGFEPYLDNQYEKLKKSEAYDTFLGSIYINTLHEEKMNKVFLKVVLFEESQEYIDSNCEMIEITDSNNNFLNIDKSNKLGIYESLEEGIDPSDENIIDVSKYSQAFFRVFKSFDESIFLVKILLIE